MNSKHLQVLQAIVDNELATLTEISLKFSITERALRYQIEKINEFLESSKIISKLEIKKGKIEISEKNLIKKYLKNFQIEISNTDRKELLALIILLNEKCNLTNLAKQFDLTRNSLKNSLLEVRKIFSNYDLELEYNNELGYIILGEEEDIRRAQYEIISKTFFKESILLEGNKAKLFSDYFDLKLRENVNDFIKNLEKTLKISLNDRNYKIIYLYIMIVIKRIENGESYLKRIDNENFLKSTVEFINFQEVFKEFQKKLKINIPYFDKLKIFEITLGFSSIIEEKDYMNNWISLELKIKKIIQQVGKELNIDFFKDTYLYRDLINHIRPMLYRVKNGFTIMGDELEEFKVQNENFFKIVEKVLIQEFKWIDWSKNEEGIFIAIHFKVAYDRISQFYKTRKNILVVCNFGYGTGKLIGNQIIEKFDVNLMGIVSFKELELIELSTIDFIITTLNPDIFKNISLENSKIIKVKPILSTFNLSVLNELGLEFSKKQHDINEVMRIIKKYYPGEENFKLKNELNFLLNKSLVEYNEKKDEKIMEIEFFENEKDELTIEDAIKKSAQPLIDNDFIDCLYVNEMLKVLKTNLDYVVLENGTMIPHASNKFVYKKGCSILNLKKEIMLENNLFIKKIVIFVSPKVRDYSKFYQKLISSEIHDL